MIPKTFTLLVFIVAILHCRADLQGGETSVAVGQPSIFWHNGEWQTYNDGVWTPYCKPLSNRVSQSRTKEGAADSRSQRGDRGVVRRSTLAKSSNPSAAGIGATTIGIGQPNGGIGQSTGGIGKPNVGIGRTTIGIGQPNVAIGQPNAIGQTTIGIGKPNTSIGQNTTGIGRPNIAIGQPNSIGQTTIGIGKPSAFPNQQSSVAETAR